MTMEPGQIEAVAAARKHYDKHTIGIFIDIEANHDLTTEEVWPDGDAPETFTADDVMALLTKNGLSSGLREWELLTGLNVTVRVYSKDHSSVAEATT